MQDRAAALRVDQARAGFNPWGSKGSAMAKQVKLTLGNLKDLDLGRIEAQFQADLQHVVQDCKDRPLDGRARTVAVMFKIVPDVSASDGTNAECDAVKIGAEISSSVPRRRTKVYTMSCKHDGSLAFYPDLPDEPEGSTLLDDMDR
jgi:hypothetical protein